MSGFSQQNQASLKSSMISTLSSHSNVSRKFSKISPNPTASPYMESASSELIQSQTVNSFLSVPSETNIISNTSSSSSQLLSLVWSNTSPDYLYPSYMNPQPDGNLHHYPTLDSSCPPNLASNPFVDSFSNKSMRSPLLHSLTDLRKCANPNNNSSAYHHQPPLMSPEDNNKLFSAPVHCPTYITPSLSLSDDNPYQPCFGSIYQMSNQNPWKSIYSSNASPLTVPKAFPQSQTEMNSPPIQPHQHYNSSESYPPCSTSPTLKSFHMPTSTTSQTLSTEPINRRDSLRLKHRDSIQCNEEYKRKRERNNIAVRKSREKAKNRLRDNESKVHELVLSNEHLRKQIKILSKVLQRLHLLVKSCGVSTEIINREISRSVNMEINCNTLVHSNWRSFSDVHITTGLVVDKERANL